MPTHAEFIRNIAQHPADMFPREVYAEWLEERGDVRAEYIRLAIELAEWGTQPKAYGNWNVDCRNREDYKGTDNQCTIPPNPWRKHCEFHELKFKCDTLFAEHRREWTMAGLPVHWTFGKWVTAVFIPNSEYGDHQLIEIDFARGFPEVLTLRWEEWQAHYRTLIDAMPVREVRLTTRPSDKWLVSFLHECKVRLPDNFTGNQRLIAEFPGHDPANPIKYTLPANVVTDGFVQVDFESLFQTAAPE